MNFFDVSIADGVFRWAIGLPICYDSVGVDFPWDSNRRMYIDGACGVGHYELLYFSSRQVQR